MKRPNPVAHMARYGFVLGFILCLIFIWITAIIHEGIPNDIVFFMQFSVTLSPFVGSIPGLFIGFTTGSVLGFITHRIQYPIEHDAFQQVYKLALFVIGGLTFVSSGILVSLIAIFLGLWFILPAIIATIASLYAVHRYMLKLRAWANVGKMKNDYKLKNQLAYDDTVAEDYLLTSEPESQQENHR